LHLAVVNRVIQSRSLGGNCHGSPSEKSLKAGERRWLPQMLKQQPKPDAAQKHVDVNAGAAALLELGLFYWKNSRSKASNRELLPCGSAIFIF
jgi:hypothetical protein